MTYSLQAAPPSREWATQAAEPQPGAGLVAIPRLQRGAEATDAGTHLAVVDATPGTGFTSFAVFVFDQNGLLGNVCQTLHTRQMAYLTPRLWGLLPPGFRGTALVSAVYWDHELPGDAGQSHNLVNLAAVTVQRGSGHGIDGPDAEAVGEAGIPLSRTVAREMARALPFGPDPCWRP